MTRHLNPVVYDAHTFPGLYNPSTNAAVLAVGFVTGKAVVLGLEPKERLMLVLTLFLSFMTFGGLRTSVLQDAIHLLVFAAYVMLIFDRVDVVSAC